MVGGNNKKGRRRRRRRNQTRPPRRGGRADIFGLSLTGNLGVRAILPALDKSQWWAEPRADVSAKSQTSYSEIQAEEKEVLPKSDGSIFIAVEYLQQGGFEHACGPFVTSGIILSSSAPSPNRLGTWKVREGDPIYRRGETDPDGNALACRQKGKEKHT